MLVDDHEIVRTGVRRALEPHRDIDVIAEAGSGRELLALPELASTDVLLLDMNLPDTEALRLIPQVLEKTSRIRILVFSMQPEDGYAVAALRAGAAGFLGKDKPTEELVAAIRKVAGGGKIVSDVLAEQLLGSGDVKSALPHESLSDRERQIFDRIIRGASPGEVAAELDLGTSTVATYLQRIRDKIGVESNFELVQYAFRRRLVT